jgi:beta-glucosidase
MKRFIKKKSIMLSALIILFIPIFSGAYFLIINKEVEKKAVNNNRVQNILAGMSLQDKIGQMVLIDKDAISLDDVRRKSIGGVLSGGGGNPAINSPQEWRRMVEEFQIAAMGSRLKIPLFYGVDAVHGHGNLFGAVIFPHNIGLGATRDATLVEKVAAITAQEIKATGVNWNFAPVVSMPGDLRWGRVFECFSTDIDVVTELSLAYAQGTHSQKILSTPKHFIGEGTEDWKTSKDYYLDQGDITMSIEDIKTENLMPFKKLIETGSMSIMVSRSSINGDKISGNKSLLTDLLKNELGFKGFLVSDWGAVDQISDDYYNDIISSVNAGMDMVMLPGEYDTFMNNITSAVNNGKIPVSRIDDAVSRILTAKDSIDLFEPDKKDNSLIENIGSEEHRDLARQAVRQSLVLLKNENQALPIKDAKNVLVIGRAADDVGMQAGGWTINWQGGHGSTTQGTSILTAIKNEFKNSKIKYDAMANGVYMKKAEISLVVVGEQPYAEGMGDRERLTLSPEDQKRISFSKKNSNRVVLIILAGRPLIIEDIINDVDAVVMAWLPGTEATGISDVLSGKYDFSGKLPLAWPRTMEQIENKNLDNPLFEFGYGLRLLQ